MHQNTPNYNSDTHFGQLSFLGGALGAQSGFWAVQGVFSKARALVFFTQNYPGIGIQEDMSFLTHRRLPTVLALCSLPNSE